MANTPARVLRFRGQSSDEGNFAHAFEHSPNGMAILDSNGCITHASRALRKLLGFTNLPPIGLTLSEITHPDDVETEAEQRKRLAGGEIDRYQLLQRLIRADGALAWVLLSVSACPGIAGLPTQYVLQVECRDGHQSNGKAAPRDAVECLLGDAVHEIGNTLTPLMVNTQLIIERSAGGEISDAAHVIFIATRRIAFTLRRLRGLEDVQQSVAYLGESRMLDLRMVPPPDA